MESKISVVVTCYNHEKYIEECLRSIFSQTYKNIELLVFNDGSTDQSGEIISKVLEESPFPETHYSYADNQGVCAVRNQGLEKMTGDFLLFMDSDNFLNENHIEVLMLALTENSADIAYCQLWDFVNQRNVLRADLGYSFEKELEGNLIDVCSLIKKDVLYDAKFDPHLKNLEDFDFWLNILVNHQARPIFAEGTQLNYRALASSRSSRENWTKYYNSYFYILNKYRKQIPDDIIQACQKNILLWINNYEQLEAESKQNLADKERHIKYQEVYAEKALHDKDVHIASQKQEIEVLRQSKSYRLGNKILHPFRKK